MRSFLATLAILGAVCILQGTAKNLRPSTSSHEELHDLSHSIDTNLHELTDFLDQSSKLQKRENAKLPESARFKTQAELVSVDPVAAESALKPNEGPSDRVTVAHLDVAEASASSAAAPQAAQPQATPQFKAVSTIMNAAPISQSRFSEVQDPTALQPAAAVSTEFYPPPIMQAELERPQDDPNGIYTNPAQDGLDAGEGWEESDNMAMRMSEQGGPPEPQV